MAYIELILNIAYIVCIACIEPTADNVLNTLYGLGTLHISYAWHTVCNEHLVGNMFDIVQAVKTECLAVQLHIVDIV